MAQLKPLPVLKDQTNFPSRLDLNKKNPTRKHATFVKPIKNKIFKHANNKEEEEEKSFEIDQEKIKK